MRQCPRRHGRYNPHKKYDSIFLRDAHRLHSHEHHTARNPIINQLGGPHRHPKPVCKYLSAAIDVPAYANHDGQTIHHKYEPAEYFLCRPMEQFALKTFDQLHTAIVIRKLRNDQMQNHIDDIGQRHHPYHIQHTVFCGQIRHRDDAGSDTVSYNHANCFKRSQLCLRFELHNPHLLLFY